MEFVMEGEPLIYSLRSDPGGRRHSMIFFKTRQWRSMLKCFFRAYMKSSIPVVLIVKFYVSPPDNTTVTKRRIKKEIVPAVNTWEICDYLLAFLQMLFQVLFTTYRQIVKIDAEKFYSNNPRTVFKFMSWEHYVVLQDKDFTHPKGKSFREDANEQMVQPKRKRNGTNNKRDKGTVAPGLSDAARPNHDDHALSPTCEKVCVGETKEVP